MNPKYNFNEHWKIYGNHKLLDSKKSEAIAFLKPLFLEIDKFHGIPKVLDVGCGDGVHAVAILEKITVPLYYTGIEQLGQVKEW